MKPEIKKMKITDKEKEIAGRSEYFNAIDKVRTALAKGNVKTLEYMLSIPAIINLSVEVDEKEFLEILDSMIKGTISLYYKLHADKQGVKK